MMDEERKAHARKISVIEGVFATIWGQFTGGFGGNAYLTGFFLWLGASPFAMSMYNSVFALANVIQPASLSAMRKFTSKKKLVQLLVLATRPTFFVLIFTAFLQANLRVWVAISLLFLFALITSMAGAPWQSWMSEIVDHRRRGSYFGMRSLITDAVAVPSALLAGYILDTLGKGFLAFGVVFAIGSIAGAFDAYTFKLQDEIVSKKERVFNLSVVFEVLRIPGDYRKFLLAFTFWNFSAALIGPYPVVMLIDNFKYTYSTLGIMSVVMTTFSAAFQPIWGKLGDRYGFLKMLKFALLFQTMLAFMWFIAVPWTYYILILYALIGIVVRPGTLMMSFNALMGLVPTFGKTEAFSAYTSITSMASFLGNICSGVIVTVFSGLSLNWGIWDVNAYRVVFLISFAVRIAATFYMFRLTLTNSNR